MRATRRTRDAYAKTPPPPPPPPPRPPPFYRGSNGGRYCATALSIFRTRLHNIRVGNRIKGGCSLQRTVLFSTNYVFISSRHAN
jgi:hypothetical protein